MWPLNPADEGHIPIAELPASAKELSTYDLIKAKQMLVDAGYPKGFKAKLIISTRLFLPEMGELIAGIWKKNFGIELSLEVVELGVMARIAQERQAADWNIY